MFGYFHLGARGHVLCGKEMEKKPLYFSEQVVGKREVISVNKCHDVFLAQTC